MEWQGTQWAEKSSLMAGIKSKPPGGTLLSDAMSGLEDYEGVTEAQMHDRGILPASARLVQKTEYKPAENTGDDIEALRELDDDGWITVTDDDGGPLT